MAKRLTRRDFLKGSAAGAAALTLTGLGLGANSTAAFAEASEKKLFTPGSYSSVQSTEFATVRIDCEIDAGGVTGVSFEVLDHTGDDYFTLMPDAAEDYCRRMEQNIREQPSYWLWTHDRFKRTRQKYIDRLRRLNRHHDLENDRFFDHEHPEGVPVLEWEKQHAESSASC